MSNDATASTNELLASIIYEPTLLKTGVNIHISREDYQQAQTLALSADIEALGSLCNLLAASNRITRAARSC